MKKLVLSLAVIAFMFASCGEKKSNSHSLEEEEAHALKTHQHEDGSVHEEHLDEKHQQEEFKVELDSVSNNAENHEHNHEDEHQH
jgi:hypothetical protein